MMRTIAVTAVAALALAGCSVPTEQPPVVQVDRTQASAEQEAATAGPEQAPEQEAATTEPGLVDAAKEYVQERTPPMALSTDEDAAVYLFAKQAFSPKLVLWEINQEQTELGYREHNCLGGIEAEGYASLAPRDKPDEYQADWLTPNPMSGTRSAYLRMEITDQVLTPGSAGVATTFHDSVLREFRGMCTQVGKQVADFVLP